jgi:hypothetical protein
MFEFHKNRKHYFEMQVNNAAQFVIPFIEQKINITPGMQVLEIGCGEGGVLKAFINKGWINRNNILVNGKSSMFTIPLVGASQNRLIRDIEVDNLAAWSKKFLKTVEQSYKKAPFYIQGFQLLEQIFNLSTANIAELGVNSLKETCKYLNIETEIVESSTIYNNQDLKAQGRILDICLQEKAYHYINPIGGMAIYDKQLFADKEILLNFIKAKPIQYKQFNKDDESFVPWLSIIDFLMFCSVEEINEHLNKFELV